MDYNLNLEENANIDLKDQLSSIIQGQTNFISNASNLTSLVYYTIKNLNWVGFYLISGDELILGPFQGKPACIKIDIGKGVCGGAAESGNPIIVSNVLNYPGHIACDPLSRSEMVIPFYYNNKLVGVFDLDSPVHDRFRESDLRIVQELLDMVVESSDLESVINYYEN